MKKKVTCLAVGAGRLCRRQPQIVRGLRMFRKESVQIFIVRHLNQMPVVQTRAPDGAVRDLEPQRTDEVQPAAGSRTGAGDVAAVLRNFRFDQNDVEH